AAQSFPAPGVAFADTHAALAHAFAGNGGQLAVLIERAARPAAEVGAPLSRAFRAFACEDFPAAASPLADHLAPHQRIGGGRAQRDLMEYALVVSKLRQGHVEEARRLLHRRRPLAGAHGYPIAGV